LVQVAGLARVVNVVASDLPDVVRLRNVAEDAVEPVGLGDKEPGCRFWRHLMADEEAVGSETSDASNRLGSPMVAN
jgi:hypothetical protein